MATLMILADDFTGALDTGVQFAACGASVRVQTGADPARWDLAADPAVLVVDAESRHLPPGEAFRRVRALVAWARGRGVHYIYKKTDSALRGNIGAELEGVLAATGRARLHFVPAFPLMGRTTVGGIHFIGGEPVHHSVFGEDPFEPVQSAYIPQIIRAQSRTPVRLLRCADLPAELPDGILLYDANTDAELAHIAGELARRGELELTAGCAGFASALPGLLGLGGTPPALPSFPPALLTVCCSVNPITLAQLDDAQAKGFARVTLTPEQKCTPGYFSSPEGRRTLDAWHALFRAHKRCILDAGAPMEERGDTKREAERLCISGNLSCAVRGLLDRGLDAALLLTGGDMLVAFLKQMGAEAITPLCELLPGTVLSRLESGGHTHTIFSKSGGFGERELLSRLAGQIGC